MFRMGAGRHFLKLEVKLYNRDFFLPLFPRPHYKYSWHLITIAGNAESDCSNPGGQVAGSLLPELTPPHPVHNSQWIYCTGLRCSDSFQPLLLWNGHLLQMRRGKEGKKSRRQ